MSREPEQAFFQRQTDSQQTHEEMFNITNHQANTNKNYNEIPPHIYQNACMFSCFSHVQLFATPQTVAHHTPLSMGFSRQEYWSELPFLSPGDPPNPGTELKSPVLQVDSLLLSHREEWLQLKRQQITNVGKDVEKREPSYTVGRNVNSCNHDGKQYKGSSKKIKNRTTTNEKTKEAQTKKEREHFQHYRPTRPTRKVFPQKTLCNSRIHTPLQCTGIIFQDKPQARPYYKAQQI